MNRRTSTVLGALCAAALAYAIGGCGLVDTTTCEDGPNGPGGQPYTFLALAFPEKQCEQVKFPLGKFDVGGVFGRVVDSAGTPVEGAKVFAGASATFTGPIPVSDASASDATLTLAQRAKHKATLEAGQFVLLNLPVQTTVVTVQYDDQSFPFPVTLKSSKIFDLTVASSSTDRFGLLDKGDVPLDLKLPEDNSYGMRILRFEPSELTATATGSKVTFTGGSIVNLSLRNGPHANSAEIVKVKVDYQNEEGNTFKSATKPVSATIVPAGLSFTSGPITKLTVDLADSTLGTGTTGNATAKITLTIKDLKTGTESTLGDGKAVLSRSVPIQITRQ